MNSNKTISIHDVKKTLDQTNDLIMLGIHKKTHIDDFNTQDILDFLNEFKTLGKKGMNRLSIIIGGYDDDPRELYEIPEVVEFIQFIDKSFPYWFFFLEKDTRAALNPLIIIFACCCQSTIVKKKGATTHVSIEAPKIEEFLNIHFQYLNELTDELGLPESVNKELSERVLEIILQKK